MGLTMPKTEAETQTDLLREILECLRGIRATIDNEDY